MSAPAEPAGQAKQHLVSQQSAVRSANFTVFSLEICTTYFDFKVMCRIDDKQESFFGFSH